MRSTQSIGTFDGPRSPKPSASSASAAAHNNILRIKSCLRRMERSLSERRLRRLAGRPSSAQRRDRRHRGRFLSAQGSPRPRRCPGTQAPRHQVMSTMPDHLRPIMVEIPVTWTAEQALAVCEMLDELREKIWARYSCQLQDLLAEQQRCAGVDDGDTGSWTIDF